MKKRFLSSQVLLFLMLGFSGTVFLKGIAAVATIGIIDWNTVLFNSLINNENEADIINTLHQALTKRGSPLEIKLNLKLEEPETRLTLAGYAYSKGQKYSELLREIRTDLGCPMMRFANNKDAEEWSKKSIIDHQGCAYGGTGIHKLIK